ncbi:hypothetical protein NDU88_007258 [Pleurodeles waltl]|uniref:Uncharacterized protein n=1 Tax=Pleurodeles waltl TaxID=8319 RepID=A0AAV7QNJ0_PLEWA|nr:hypothetical protein NDU88_007258 [Pleurodeles waltl]
MWTWRSLTQTPPIIRLSTLQRRFAVTFTKKLPRLGVEYARRHSHLRLPARSEACPRTPAHPAMPGVRSTQAPLPPCPLESVWIFPSTHQQLISGCTRLHQSVGRERTGSVSLKLLKPSAFHKSSFSSPFNQRDPHSENVCVWW